MILELKEGWAKFYNSKKWHYLVNGQSLCMKWICLGSPDLEHENDNSLDNCAICKRKLKKRNK